MEERLAAAYDTVKEMLARNRTALDRWAPPGAQRLAGGSVMYLG